MTDWRELNDIVQKWLNAFDPIELEAPTKTAKAEKINAIQILVSEEKKSEKRLQARMDKDEKKWEARKAKIEKFKTELKDLMEKYGFGKSESDNYDAMEEYCGTSYYFVIDDEPWHNESIEDIIKECIFDFSLYASIR